MFKEVDVIFFVEHKDRELESIKLIAEKLNNMGYSSIILSTIFHLHYIFFYKAKVFVFPYLISKNDWPVNLVYKLYGENVSYINLNWEQLIAPVIQQYKKPKDLFVKSVVKHVSWDDDGFKSFLIENGVEEENIKVTGNPTNFILFELNKKDKQVIKNQLSFEFDLDKNKEWLFMPMNYGWAFSSDKTIKSKILKGFPEKEAWEYRKYSKKCLNEFIKFISDVSIKDELEIVIRPHPGVSIDDYKNKFIEIVGEVPANVYILKNHTIREWIIASDIIGSSWSTSAYDAQKINKKAFLFFPFEMPKWLYSTWLDNMIKITNYEEYKRIGNIIIGVKEHNEIENISSLIKENIPQTKTNINGFNIGLIGFSKIFKSFLMNIGFIKKKSLDYDKFDKIIYEK